MKQKVLHVLETIEEFIASFFFIAGSVICIYGVFMRYVMNNPITWTTEVFETLMVTAIFIGFGIALKDNHHIAVDLLYEKMPKAGKKIFNIISNLLGAGFSIFLTIMGAEMVKVSYAQGSLTIDVGMPVWITYLAMPIGMGLLSFYFLVKTYQAITNQIEEIDTTENAENMF